MAGLAGFCRSGATVGLAWDAGAGALLMAVDGADPKPLFPTGLQAGLAVGVGLFPALSGRDGCRVGVNLGQRPFRHAPPAGFLACSSAAPAALEPVCCAHGVWQFSSIFRKLLVRVCGRARADSGGFSGPDSGRGGIACRGHLPGARTSGQRAAAIDDQRTLHSIFLLTLPSPMPTGGSGPGTRYI
jgi:hypothetical protein